MNPKTYRSKFDCLIDRNYLIFNCLPTSRRPGASACLPRHRGRGPSDGGVTWRPTGEAQYFNVSYLWQGDEIAFSTRQLPRRIACIRACFMQEYMQTLTVRLPVSTSTIQTLLAAETACVRACLRASHVHRITSGWSAMRFTVGKTDRPSRDPWRAALIVGHRVTDNVISSILCIESRDAIRGL